jgi:polysaccharide biosynthesis transport protein
MVYFIREQICGSKKMNPKFAFNQTSVPEQVHLIDYLNIVKKRKWVVIAFFLAVVGIITTKSFLSTPIYKATAQIIIRNHSSFMNEMADVSRTDPKDQAYYQTQYNLLTSKSLIKKVIEDLKLWEVFSIRDETGYTDPLTAPDIIDSSRSSSTIDSSNEAYSALEEKKTPEPDPMIVYWYLSRLEVMPLPETHLVNLSFLHHSPQMAARVVNAHARAFIESNNQTQRLAAQQALEWLKTQIQDQKIKVGTSQKEAYEYKYKQLRSSTIDNESIFVIPEVEQNVIVRELYAKLGKLKAERSILATRYGPRHHKIIEIDSSIRLLEKGIADEIQSIRRVIKTELNRMRAIEKSTEQNQNMSQHIVEPHAEKAVSYDIVRLEAESDKVIYDSLLKQAKEIDLTGDMERNNIRIVDKAEVPLFPVKPRILLNILLSVVLGLTFGTGLAFFIEYLDRTIKTPEDITKYLGLSVFGVIPYNRSLNRKKISILPWNEAHLKKLKPVRNKYKSYNVPGSFIARLPLMQPGMLGHVYMVESTTGGEGKTTVLANLAMNLEKSGLRVVLVDADIHHPSLHKIFGMNNNGENGLLHAMKGVLSQNIMRGDLKDYSVDDLFSIIALKKLSGQLAIKNDALSMTAFFKNGRLFHIQSKDIPFKNRLGTMLLHGGFITEDQLKDALERNQRTGFPLGYILINTGYVNQEQLKGPLKLQMDEHLQKLFSWKHGTFIFESGSVEIYEDRKIYFEEDYTPIVRRLGYTAESRLLKREVFSHVQQINGMNTSLLPAGTGRINHDSPLYFALLSKFLYLLKQQYDVVLVDAPPLMDAMNTSIPLLEYADGVIFVVKAGHASVDLINKAIRSVKESQCNVVGTILNQAKIGKGY